MIYTNLYYDYIATFFLFMLLLIWYFSKAISAEAFVERLIKYSKG